MLDHSLIHMIYAILLIKIAIEQISDFKRRMQNLLSRVDELLNVQKSLAAKDSAPRSLLVKTIIAKNQEILCAAAAKVYQLHEMVRILLGNRRENNSRRCSIFSCFHIQHSLPRQIVTLEGTLGLESLNLNDPNSNQVQISESDLPCTVSRYDRLEKLSDYFSDSITNGGGPPPLEHVVSNESLLSTYNDRTIFRQPNANAVDSNVVAFANLEDSSMNRAPLTDGTANNLLSLEKLFKLNPMVKF